MSLIVLGNVGSYTDLAAKKLIKALHLNDSITYYHHIDACFDAFKENDYLVLPIENSIDGFLQHHMDLLYASKASVIKECYVPISFDYISQIPITDVKHIIGHETALHQCSEFIKKIPHAKLHISSNNVETLNQFNQLTFESAGAIIPSHLVPEKIKLHIKHVHNATYNYTRFFLISKTVSSTDLNHFCYMVIEPYQDYPGLLQEILADFKQARINLTSIISRPLKTMMGHYRFFIECDLSHADLDIFLKLKTHKNYHLHVLGSYKKEDINPLL